MVSHAGTIGQPHRVLQWLQYHVIRFKRAAASHTAALGIALGTCMGNEEACCAILCFWCVAQLYCVAANNADMLRMICTAGQCRMLVNSSTHEALLLLARARRQVM